MRIDAARVKPNTRQSRLAVIGEPLGEDPNAARTSKLLPGFAAVIPAAAAMATSKRLSVSNCRITLARLAPIESRTAISRCRAALRERIKFAEFAQEINKTSATIPAKAYNGASI